MQSQDVEQLVGSLEAEVNNGGFDQFFFNSLSDRTPEIIQALELIGASRTADIVKRAAAKFPAGMPPSEWAKRQDLLVDEVSPEADASRNWIKSSTPIRKISPNLCANIF